LTDHRIALIPGDGVGREVLPAATAVLDAVAARHGFSLGYDSFDWSCRRYLEEGSMMPADGLDQIRQHDAILLGAVGWPGVPDHVSLWGLLIPIRRTFDQYVNRRPITVFDGVRGPLRPDLTYGDAGPVDIVVVRENCEGEYSDRGTHTDRGLATETVVQESVFTRAGITRIADYAFTLAAERQGTLTSATKSNGLIHSMPFWDKVVAERAKLHPHVEWRSEHVDALTAGLVLKPRSYDVIVASNLFGDILSDLAAAVSGSIGMAPSANLNPERDHPSMFEPVHGSAPDIAGRGVANPVGAIWSAAMLLDHLGYPEAAAEVLDAIRRTVATAARVTPDLGGHATTQQMAAAVIDNLTV
jgi:tartrate dehydrogenase/decarboxylase/D-malate dehydrogenase